MSANQRRPGFRLPWVASEGGNPADAPDQPTTGDNDKQQTDASGSDDVGTAPEPATEQEPAAPATSAGETPASVASTEGETPGGADEAPGADEGQSPEQSTGSSTFLNELVAAMRRVAEQARESGLSELKGRADELVSRAQAASEERATKLRVRADVDVAEVGEWAKREADRIREEAERRVAERRTKLDEELAAESRRAEQESKALRIRVAEYERQLEGYYTRLAQIDDPAAFAAAAKRIPQPPQLGEAGDAAGDEGTGTEPADMEAAGESVAAAEGSETLAPVPMAEEVDAGTTAADSGQPSQGAKGEAIPEAPATAVAPEAQEPDEEGNITTSVVVTGLASFGAITGFRQSLAGVDGVRSVQLSLGPTGEFLYRAAHSTEVDLADAIGSLEGEAARVERDPNGTLRVVISRAR
jgi:hypothetical protein